MKKYMKVLVPLLCTIVLLFADQITKSFAVKFLKNKSDYPLIPGILEFSYLENTGAAFSFFLGKQGFLITLTICVMLLIIWKYFQIPEDRHYLLLRIGFVLIVSGGIGNLIDRIMNRYVVDFIYFVPINFPKFNIADCYVSIGVVLLAILMFFFYKEDELEFLFTFNKKTAATK